MNELARIEATTDITPFTDQVHVLLNNSIEKIAQNWCAELEALRKNATDLENQVLACVVSTKASVNRLHELGAQVAEEAKRGREVCARLSATVEEIAATP
jgi:hypothetical protein